MTKPRLAISFSGGRSSAVMLDICLAKYDATHDISIVFANTGCEHEATLDFVDAVDRNFAGGRVIWIEAEFHERGKGPTARIVDYETAARHNEPFREACKKHGVFCRTHPQCTSRPKEEPMISYRRSIGWEAGSYVTAIGIRADEADRMSAKAEAKRFIYPLIESGWTKQRVNRFMSKFDWDLKLPSDAYGNCVWCWKKSFRKLFTVAKADPSVFDFPGEMERRHGMDNHGKGEQLDPRVFFRTQKSAQDILRMAMTEDFEPYTDKESTEYQQWFDLGAACGDSCEIGAD